jgi:multisubunit Na+/H+ antiporter MnhF subunit
VTSEPTYLDSLVVVTLLGFIGTITVARYIERRGTRA